MQRAICKTATRSANEGRAKYCRFIGTRSEAYESKSFASNLDETVIELSKEDDRWGYPKVHDRMKLDGHRVGRERVRLVCVREGLQVRKKQSKKRYPGSNGKLLEAMYPNHVWTYDFIMDRTMDGRRLKCLTVTYEFTHIGLAIEGGRSMTSGDVKKVLELLFATHGKKHESSSPDGSRSTMIIDLTDRPRG